MAHSDQAISHAVKPFEKGDMGGIATASTAHSEEFRQSRPRHTLRNLGMRIVMPGMESMESSLECLAEEDFGVTKTMRSIGETAKEPGVGKLQYDGPVGRIRLPGSHWTQNPMALEMMKAMSFKYTVPSLQPRLTKFHGTRVPVLVLFFLFSTEVGRLAILDTFWKRIVQHEMVWQGLYCRDYNSTRCVWRTLHGLAGAKRCLCHLGNTHPAEFVRITRQITEIPGRSDEELMEDYCTWHSHQKALFEVLEARQTLLIPPTSEAPSDPISVSLPEKQAGARMPQTVRLISSYGSKVVTHSRQLQKPKPVLQAASWTRDMPCGRPFKQHVKKLRPPPDH
jgi:hypothetical protein